MHDHRVCKKNRALHHPCEAAGVKCGHSHSISTVFPTWNSATGFPGGKMKGQVGVRSILHALRWKGGWVQAFMQALVLERIQVFPWKDRLMCCPCTLYTKTHETAGGCSLPTSDFQIERQVGVPSGFPQTSIEGQVGALSLHQAIHKGRWKGRL